MLMNLMICMNKGYKGKLSITIKNNSTNTYILMPKMKIVQVVFESLDYAVTPNLLYSNEKHPLYQNEDGLQGSKTLEK